MKMLFQLETEGGGNMADQKNTSFDALNRIRLAMHVRAIRESKGMTKQQLAERSGYDPGMITAIESATRDPDSGKIKELANALDVSIEQLRGYGKIELTEKGWPKLSESEKTALYLIAPILKVLNEEDRWRLIDAGLILCKSEGKVPAWKQTEFQKNKSREEESREK